MQPDTPQARGGGSGLVVTVDHDVCSGTAHCQQALPAVFAVINRKSHIRPDVEWTSVDRAALDATADACPWFAISVSEAPMDQNRTGGP